ncbi:DUF2029 domain-containing protein [Lacinutrix sp. WUR7]|uniref:glycosyltransferase family 87 protein n=1 Tax=Lacinutrix sp. WUR7 TaxID=2653681 RepID=UPI00193DC80C|nr:glycosyltransferase family 87 protein [Lacinutrix sp. WUR7]QRM89034.1 DUF2029 domain-containing protein [Lacinutrix sp. WUR7]
MKNLFTKYRTTFVSLLPILLFLGYFFYKSLSFPLHDFANSYFPAYIVANASHPDTILFDIYAYNNYIWNVGYPEVLADFYINSPFNVIAFYPFVFIENAYIAKAVFNSISMLLFVFSIVALYKRYGEKSSLLLYVLPFLFYTPLRNQMLFGQTYFLVFALIVFSFLRLEKARNKTGGLLLTLAALLKVFPVFYGIILVFNTNRKAIVFAFISGFVLLFFGIWITGTPLWQVYFLEVIPNVIANKSTVNFQFNAQSLDVFYKTLFVQDAYYNPNVLFNSERLYFLAKWITKSVILGFAISMSFKAKKEILTLLSIWIVTLFLVQSRTATYAQILWIIPAFYVFNANWNKVKKVSFFLLLFVMCNVPMSLLEDLPVLLRFSRMWLSLLLAILLFSNMVKCKPLWCIGALFVLLLPLHLDMFQEQKIDASKYVLEEQKYFMIYDFSKSGNVLTYAALGKSGKEIIQTEIPIYTFDKTACTIENNQILYHGKPITNDPSLKKKPVLINNSEVYYLTDSKSRRGAFTLKKLHLNIKD